MKILGNEGYIEKNGVFDLEKIWLEKEFSSRGYIFFKFLNGRIGFVRCKFEFSVEKNFLII